MQKLAFLFVGFAAIGLFLSEAMGGGSASLGFEEDQPKTGIRLNSTLKWFLMNTLRGIPMDIIDQAISKDKRASVSMIVLGGTTFVDWHYPEYGLSVSFTGDKHGVFRVHRVFFLGD